MKVLVTGGGGFLGQALCRGLRARGHEVVSFNRGLYPALDAMGVTQARGDLANRDAVIDASRGCDAIFHNAAKAGAWSRDPREFHDANVVGTRHVIDACREHRIARLVYTSSPSVTHRATFPVAGLGADDVPYGEHLKSPYAQTKKIAEQMVLAAGDATLAVVALRPRLIWGPGDNQLLPRIVERARAGRLKLVGDGSNLVDTTYIDNAAEAHFAAFEHLAPGSACAGRAYFISNGAPRSMRETLTALLEAAGAPPPNGSVPFPVAYAIGAASEAAWSLLPLHGEPPMTRFLAEQLVTTHWYSMAPAARDFGWLPRVSFDDGLAQLRTAWQGSQASLSGA
ncbi:2-alkyl-3-oxoalkanoate reductase [Cognatilysobacter lacus]|uniref:NAD-dependent epimerase/dehydratase family protein n=1 Tax=Cognatilysobacter lacus TaxID=1643323 RepID=A0A5D8Z655_9GAMM|nr:2-alkyl-3-oxoalkanoate reductase [Lysobacter lacus]TZF90239.1 NAD-dependent epimerase/dehydratase family protein [Lysobacter lacus]